MVNNSKEQALPSQAEVEKQVREEKTRKNRLSLTKSYIRNYASPEQLEEMLKIIQAARNGEFETSKTIRRRRKSVKQPKEESRRATFRSGKSFIVTQASVNQLEELKELINEQWANEEHTERKENTEPAELEPELSERDKELKRKKGQFLSAKSYLRRKAIFSELQEVEDLISTITNEKEF